MSNIFYEGSDGHIHSLGDDNSIKHYKYIKKIKSGSGYRYFYNQDEIDTYYKDNIEKDKIVKDKIEKDKKYKYDYSPETKKRAERKKKIKNAINEKIDRTSKSIEKGRSAVEKKLKKTKKTAKNEVKGIKRATNAVRDKGDYAYDGRGNYYNWKKMSKSKKSGKVEKTIIKAYRKTHPYE